MLARSHKKLIAITSAVAVATTGEAVAIRPRNDEVNDQDQSFVAVFNLIAAGGSSPTLDAVVETSWDQVTWFTAASMTQLAGAGTKKQLVAAAIMGPYARVVVTPGGSTAPNVTGSVLLASSGGLR